MNNTEFLTHPLPRHEKLFGAAWLLFETLLFSNLLQSLNLLLPTPLPQSEINFLFFAVNLLVVCLLLREYLLGQLRLARLLPGKIFLAAVVGFVSYQVLSFLVSNLIYTLDPAFFNVNDATLVGLTAESFPLMFLGTVLFVPIAEESLFRGVLFRGLYDRSRVLAWAVSVSAFSLVHIIGYLGTYPLDRLLLSFLQYLPAGICLALSYRLSGSLLSPILIHAAVNFVGMMLLR